MHRLLPLLLLRTVASEYGGIRPYPVGTYVHGSRHRAYCRAYLC
jgi:hypothetical protein